MKKEREFREKMCGSEWEMINILREMLTSALKAFVKKFKKESLF